MSFNTIDDFLPLLPVHTPACCEALCTSTQGNIREATVQRGYVRDTTGHRSACGPLCISRRAFDSSGLMFKFVIGRTTDEKKEAALQEEIRQYDDFLRLDVAEGYVDLNKKT